ncbi:MAG: TIGR01777 family oxidoreductase [Bdellovibrionales bacterium]
MKVLLTGATGYIGGHIGSKLVALGHEVVSLTRDKKQSVDFDTKLIEMADLSLEKGIQAVIHLAGASVADKKWTAEYKRTLVSSRIAFTHRILRELDYEDLEVFLQASAIGFYQSSGDRILTEDSESGNSFLSKLCLDWEETTENLECRKAYFRIGMVLGKESPAMKKMVPLFKSRKGAALGSGKQYMSWIHIDDLSQMFIDALEDYDYSGVYNAVSPNPITNKEFTREMALAVGKSVWLPSAPSFILKMLYGEMSQILLDSHRVEPRNLKLKGKSFKYDKVDEALRASI